MCTENPVPSSVAEKASPHSVRGVILVMILVLMCDAYTTRASVAGAPAWHSPLIEGHWRHLAVCVPAGEEGCCNAAARRENMKLGQCNI